MGTKEKPITTNQNNMNEQVGNQYPVVKYVAWSVVAIIALTFIFGSFTVIGPGDRGVVLRLGSINRVLDSGLHFKIPLMEGVEKISVRTQKEQVETDAASQDLQTVKAVVAVNYNVDPDKVGDLWKTLGSEYKIRVIDPAIQEAVKAATAKYTAEHLITQRPMVKDDILLSLKTILSSKDIIVSDVSITNFDFSHSFNAAIEAKVTAEQQALQAKNLLEQKKYEAEQTVVTAKAQAEAIQIQAQAIAQQGGANYVQIEAIKKWDGKLPQQFVPNATIPFLNLK
jgi:regulator of protease activity HflC (stomatin/prohibitin superfamily)